MSHACQHLLVDSYNVLHSLPGKQPFGGRRSEAAREWLANRVRPLHDTLGIRVTLVFDGRGVELTREQPTGQPTFSLLFSPSGMTADGVIEQLVAKAKKPDVTWVVSRDNGIRETVFAAGGHCLSPDDLWEWLERTRGQQDRTIQQIAKREGKGFGSPLWPKSGE